MKPASDIQSRITLEDDVINFISTVYSDWTMRVGDLRLLGEYTNQDGPHADDYFLCFATDSSGWNEASFYSEGRDEFLASLGTILGEDLSLELGHSTDFSSRILWPEARRGEPMFAFTDVPPKSIIGRVFGSLRNRQTFTDQALSVLQSKA